MDISRAILEAAEKTEGPDVGGGPLTGRKMRFREDAEVFKFEKPPKSLDAIEDHTVKIEKDTEVEILEIFTADLVLTSLPSELGEGHCALVEWTALEEVR